MGKRSRPDADWSLVIETRKRGIHVIPGEDPETEGQIREIFYSCGGFPREWQLAAIRLLLFGRYDDESWLTLVKRDILSLRLLSRGAPVLPPETDRYAMQVVATGGKKRTVYGEYRQLFHARTLVGNKDGIDTTVEDEAGETLPFKADEVRDCGWILPA